MAAPSPTTRVTPPGIMLGNGHSTKVTIAGDPNIDFWEKTVQPPGLDGGDEIDITTMFNTTWRTKISRALIDMTPLSLTAAYDPVVYNQAVQMINYETTITVAFPDGSTLAFYGYLKTCTPQDMQEGEQPELQVEIVCTNYDPTNRVEAAPVMTSVSGT